MTEDEEKKPTVLVVDDSHTAMVKTLAAACREEDITVVDVIPPDQKGALVEIKAPVPSASAEAQEFIEVMGNRRPPRRRGGLAMMGMMAAAMGGGMGLGGMPGRGRIPRGQPDSDPYESPEHLKKLAAEIEAKKVKAQERRDRKAAKQAEIAERLKRMEESRLAGKYLPEPKPWSVVKKRKGRK